MSRRQSNEMPRNLDGHWQCQTCLHHFPREEELQHHIEAFQSRALYLFAELQKCFAHSDPDISGEGDCETSSSSAADNLANNDFTEHKKHQCPHIECEGRRPRATFTWKNLLRHYTIHVICDENCEFCGIHINRVRKYVAHFDDCKTKKARHQDPEVYPNITKAREQRIILRDRAAQELRLQTSAKANTLDEEGLSQEIDSKKRPREMADTDPENVHRSRKPRTAKEDDGDATVAIISGSSYQAPCAEDGATEIATPAHLGMSSNSTLIPVHPKASLPSHCDMDKSTTFSSAGTYSSGGTDFLQYPLGSEGTFMGEQYIGTFGRAPPLFTHTMDRSSNYPGRENQIATHASSQAMDGSSGVSAVYQYEAAGLYRAPLFASHTLDGSYQSVGHYGTSAPASVHTLYHHLAEPNIEAEAQSEADILLFRTAVGQTLTSCLLTLDSKPRSQKWRNQALETAYRVVIDHESILRQIPAEEKTLTPPPSVFHARIHPVQRSPIILRPRKSRKARNSCGSADIIVLQDRQSPSGSSDEISDVETPSKPRARTRQSDTGQVRPVKSPQAAEESDVHHRQYCTQARLLGLVRKHPLDDACPNINAHRAYAAGNHHALGRKSLAKLMSRQLTENSGNGCEPLGKQGARGALFRLTLESYGYTFVAKGTVTAFTANLRHDV